MNVRAGVIGAVDGVDRSAQHLGLSPGRLGISAVAGGELSRDDEPALAQQAGKPALTRHSPSLTLPLWGRAGWGLHPSGAFPSLPLTRLIQEEVPCSCQSTGFCRWWM